MKNNIKNLIKYGNNLLPEEMKINGFRFYLCVDSDEYYTDINDNHYNDNVVVDSIDDYDFPNETTCMYFMWAEEIIECWNYDQLQELDEQQLHEFIKDIVSEYNSAKNNKYLNFKPNGYCPVYY